MNRMRKFSLFILLIIALTGVGAQNINTHYSSWNTIDIKKEINNKWSINTEFNFRRTNFLKDWEQFIIRPFVHYKLKKNLDLAIGYSYIQNYRYSDFGTPMDFVENNIFQQLTINHKFSNFSFTHRLRFEERFQQKIIGVDNNYSINGITYKHRFRYKFQLSIPLKKFSTDRSISLVLYDEAHLDFGTGLRPEKLDQNWMFLGLSFRASKQIKIRSGYHDIYVIRGDRRRNNQIWETTITYSI